MADTIVIYEGGIGDVGGSTTPQFAATAALLPGTPLMLSAGGVVANDGTKPIIGYSPYGNVLSGQSFIPQGMDIAKVDPAATYTIGTSYYLQAGGTLGTTVTSRYAGTAINATTLILIPELVAQAAATTLIPDATATDQAPASATNKLLTKNSLLVPGTTVAGTLAAGATGSINYRIKPHGVGVSCNISAFTIADYVNFATLPTPPAGTTYMNYNGVYQDGLTQIGGIVHFVSGSISITRNTGNTGGFSFELFVNYA